MAAIAIAGFGVRGAVLRSKLGAADIDESTVGLQAMQLLHGHPAVFFPTQGYGGTLETWLVAAAFWLFGASIGTLKAVAIVAHLGACAVVWRVATRLGLAPVAALVAPTVLWLGPAAGIWESTKERGFYGVAILLASIVLLLVVREHQRHRRADLVALGACLGLAVWTTPLLGAAVVPPVGWLVVRRGPQLRHDRRGLLAALVAGVVAASPWLAWNLRHRWASLAPPSTFGTTWPGRLGDGLHRLGVVLGTSTPWVPTRRVLPFALVLAVAVALVAGASWTTRRAAPGLLSVAILGYGLLLAGNGLAVVVGPDPRYLYPLLPTLAVAAAACAHRLPGSRAGLVGLVIIGIGCLALSGWGLVGLDRVAGTDSQELFLASPGLSEVVATLDAHHVRAVITDTSGEQITFASGGRIRASTYGVPRFPEDERAARRDPTAYVLRAGYMGGDDVRLRAYLAEHRIAFRHQRIGVFHVFLLDAPLLPEQVPLRTFVGPVRSPGGS